MAKITRKTQKIFGGDYILDGAQTEIAVFGSKKDGAPTYSVDPDTIQSGNYLQGWSDAVLTDLTGTKKMPLLQDSNALFYVLSRNLAYLNQAGIAEYDGNTVYYINDICREVGTTNIYKSINNDNTGNILTNATEWESLGNLESLKQATTTSTGISYLPKQITISNNVGTPTSKIDFTAGNFNFYDGSGQGIMTAKAGDLANLFGTSDGMLDVGAVAEGTYSLFTVYNPTTGDSKPLASLSEISPDMTKPNLDGYTVLGGRITYILTDSGFNIRQASYTFSPDGTSVHKFRTRILVISDPSIPLVRTPIPTVVPPSRFGIFDMTLIDNDTVSQEIIITEDGEDDITPTNGNSTLSANNSSYDKAPGISFKVSPSGEILYRGNESGAALFTIYLIGFKDNLI